MSLSTAGRGVAGAAALIAGLTVVARIAGVARTFVFAKSVGGSTELGGVYLGANTLPNIVFELVAGGALASLVVPLLAGAVEAGDRRTVSDVSSALLTWVAILLVPMAALIAVFAHPIISALPADLPGDQLDLAARMLRVFAPQLPLYGLGIVLAGILQAHRRFAWPVIAPLLSSLVVMSAYLGYAVLDGRGTDVGGLSTAGELTLSVGTTLGVVALSGCLLIPVRRLGLRVRPRLRFPGAAGRRAVRLGWAGAVTVGSQQVALLAVLVLTWQVARQQYAAFTFAQTVFLLPWAVLAVPIATAAYPSLTAAHAVADEQRFTDTLARAARAVALFSCLGAAGLTALAVPIAGLLATQRDAPVDGLVLGLVGFAPGLLGYGLFALLSRALYARGATFAAALASACGWAVGVLAAFVLAAAFADDRRVFALCLANAVAMTVIGGLLVVAVRRHAGFAALAGLGRATAVGVTAAVLAGAAGWGVVVWVGNLIDGTPTGAESVLQGMLGGVVVAIVFAAVAYPLDRHDVRPLAVKLAGKLHRVARRPDREETS